MRCIPQLALTALITFAPADAARAESAAPVAEIVTFRLADGADPQTFAAAAARMTPFLESTGAMTLRTLSQDADGLWTDHIIWTSMAAAKSAAEAMMAEPAAGPFMSMIDPDSVTMRHAPILFQTE